MGDLVAMTRSIDRSRIAARRDGSAEIVFFTGVRYHRMIEEEAVTAPLPKSRRAVRPKKTPTAALEQRG